MGDLQAGSMLAFIVTSIVIELTPGPNMGWLAIVAAGEGRRLGYAAVAGVALGLSIVGLGAAFGLAALITASPILYEMLRWGGVAFLLYLAWEGWQRDDRAEEPLPDSARTILYFRRGLIANLLNPKAAMFFIAVLPGFVPPQGSVLAATVMLSMIYVAVATAIHAAIVTLAGAARPLLENPDKRLVVRRVLAILLAVIAVWFAWSTGRADG
ncbi:threonine/homoserine/homoserine lactone efflux protein [Albidovulum inexpectatum]|uniref:Threonine/homoserine/homoserine lactone efflux protein n=1 Tax=Albidovulum inexpectatum TaxID=196587 RepID=A0A2S5JKT2_9RHOB|nr:LysE family translocator [Albidovulum inexpectatum]PPB82167.1 threonine/homoserine/homoserine lactone efflux protein [Albidovulum inexpectatum]